MNLVKTKHNWHPNTSIEFDTNGVWLRVSLNIKPTLAQFISPNNLSKGRHRFVYCLKFHIPNGMINRETMEQAQKMLLNNCMKNIRNAEEKNKIKRKA